MRIKVKLANNPNQINDIMLNLNVPNNKYIYLILIDCVSLCKMKIIFDLNELI